MCIAITTKPGKVLSRDVLKICHINNPDGCGFAYSDFLRDRVEIFKSMDFDTFYSEYERAVSVHTESPFLIHFRIATSGTTDEFNCHPFRINDKQAFIHNGIISRVPNCPEKKRNDTQMFNELILKDLPEGWESNEAIKLLIEDFIVVSKLCILNADGSFSIINESKGTWKDDIWYSNSSYEPRVVTTSTYKGKGNYNHQYYGPSPSRTANSSNGSIFGLKEDIINRHTSKAVGAYNAYRSGTVVCDMCGNDEPIHLSKNIIIDSAEYEVCRDCVKTLNAGEIFYYEMYDKDWKGNTPTSTQPLLTC